MFKILSESGIASGVRRIEAITGERVLRYYEEMEHKFKKSADALKVNPDQLYDRLTSLLEELKKAGAENEKLKAEIANRAAGSLIDSAVEINGIRVLVTEIPDADMKQLRNMGDTLRDTLGESALLLLSVSNGRVSLSASATDGAVKKGVHAGNLIKEVAVLVGGGGGGRPNSAEAGGKDPKGVPAALEKGLEILKTQLGARS